MNLFPVPVEDNFQDDDLEIPSETVKTKKKVEFYPQRNVQIYDISLPPNTITRPLRQSRKNVNYIKESSNATVNMLKIINKMNFVLLIHKCSY